MHILVYRSQGRSYRDLPLRLFEFGTVYRNEKSGVIHGLTRVRGMTQDDAHIFTTREEMANELKNTLGFVLSLLKDYGLNDFYLELSTKDPEKYVGDDATWEEATRPSPRSRARRGSSWSRILRAPPSTARRSRFRPATPSAAPGRCRPCSSTSTCPSASTSTTPRPTAPTSAR